MRDRGQLSGGERDYLCSKTTRWKVISFFFPGIGQIWSRRRGLFWGGSGIAVGLALLGYVGGGSGSAEGAGFISWLINVLLTLINFTEKAYQHDKPYFQRYLDEYAKMTGGKNIRNQKRTDYEEDNEEEYEERKVERRTTRKYNKYGFDQDGYNREGFDAYGYDRDGFNREGYNDEGYDKNGFDKDGYNYKGFDKNGYDKDGYDRRGFNKSGYDRDGYDEYGEKNGIKKSTTKKSNTVLSKKSKK